MLAQLSNGEQLETETIHYQLDIMALLEVRWPGNGKEVLSVGNTLIFSGHETRRETGVAVVISKPAAKSLIRWKPVSNRIVTARFYGKHAKMTLAACY